LQIKVEADRRSRGQYWAILHFSWITPQNSQHVECLTLGNDDPEPPVLSTLDGCEKRGLILASQIIQRYSGSLDLLTNTQEQIFGIRIQIPVHSLNISQRMISKAPVSAIQVQDF